MHGQAPIRLSCLVPAHDEAARIGAVLAVLARHPLIDEVIVIDDGSADGTAEIARSHPRVRVLQLHPNRGKTAALAEGLRHAAGQHVMLIDADLIGLDDAAITALAMPVLHGRADAAISLRGNAPALWRLIGLDFISGERVFGRHLLVGQEGRMADLPRWGFEVFLNDLWLGAGVRLAIVRWPDVASPAKAAKHGMLRGVRGDLRMLADIVRVAGIARVVGQIAGLRAAGQGPKSRLGRLGRRHRRRRRWPVLDRDATR
jgi:glycosyltransferase involved in cell wall biosynthesis